MAKEQKFVGIGVVKKANSISVDCGVLYTARSRKDAEKIFSEYAEMKPLLVLTEQEAKEMYEMLSALLNPPKFTKKELAEKMRELASAAGMQGKKAAKTKAKKKQVKARR